MNETSKVELLKLAVHLAELAVAKGAYDQPKKDAEWWLEIVRRNYDGLKLALVDTDHPQ